MTDSEKERMNIMTGTLICALKQLGGSFRVTKDELTQAMYDNSSVASRVIDGQGAGDIIETYLTAVGKAN